MLVQVSLLGETLIAVSMRTLVWSLVRVQSQVVEEIVPFLGNRIAVLVGAH